MKRIGVLISFCGVAFLVDVQNEQFVQYINPGNAIPFSKLQPNNEEYILLFNHLNNNAWNGNSQNLPPYVTRVKVSPIAKLDPIGISEKFAIPLSEINKWF